MHTALQALISDLTRIPTVSRRTRSRDWGDRPRRAERAAGSHAPISVSGEIDSAVHIDTAAWRPQEGPLLGGRVARVIGCPGLETVSLFVPCETGLLR
jgi:hypothetical protein